ncbi:hypothetical protein SAY86_017962 [Trapa natans]|uniref:Pentatricopeptide repeat-containing protein n=1 Tax=Trapa natans TaxID=22666 RepID=A0AAN7M2S6_TRANT|nr:hypothetical protein SAY86_017962 [Trapa natans]
MGRHVRFKNVGFSESTPFAMLLEVCGQARSVRDTRRVHAQIIKSPVAAEVFIQNRLIDLYGKCGCMDDARTMFDKMPEKNTFTWNAILNTLTKFGFIDEAEAIFGSMPVRDQCSWNSMLSGFAQHEMFGEALDCFVTMHKEDYVLNEYSFGSGLSACAGLMDMTAGEQMHALLLKSPSSSDVFMGSALIDMYSKCRHVESAQGVFDGMTSRNIVSWNSLISCYEQNGPAGNALDVFLRMMEHGFEPDEITLASVLSACATLSAVKEGLQIHARVMKFDKFRNDIVTGNALVDMYSKCGCLNEARRVFDRMPTRNVVSETSMVSGYAKAGSLKAARVMFTRMIERDIVSWNALIAGCTQNGDDEEAFGLFRLLKRDSVKPTHYTFGNLLNACANLADLQLGQQAHGHVLKHGLHFQSQVEDSDIFVGNSLIDMYMKCGSVEDGHKVFRSMSERDKVSWNAIIVGFAQNGHVDEALGLFQEMLKLGKQPDHVTMIGVLCACSHSGLVEEGRGYFQSMVLNYGLVPVKDHYTCMVDLLGRAGLLDEAMDMIEAMPLPADAVVWGSLLAACKVHRNIVLGKYVADKLLEINPSDSGPYVLLSNMYAERGRWSDVFKIRKKMREQRVVKQPGCSWVEVQGQVHVFLVKDKRHPRKVEIYSVLKALVKQMKRAGYAPIAHNDDQEDYEGLSESESNSFSYPIATGEDAATA